MGGVVHSIMNSGNQAIAIDVECHVSNGLPGIVIVGFANKAIEESKERIRGAFTNSKLDLPKKRITINLAPADIPKDSTSFDIPVAIAIMLASGQLTTLPTHSLFIGELGLNGTVRSVRGIIGKLLAGRQKGFTTFYIPAGNLKQALLVPGLSVVPVKNLRDIYLDLSETIPLKQYKSGNPEVAANHPSYSVDFGDVVGQARAKRALEIAAAGGHNVLMSGPPGTGKSMLAKALPGIMPPMDLEEMLEVTHLHSLASKNYDQIVSSRPFRSPHHSSSQVAIVGGGQYPRPGEISLAHNGVLLFDEFPEFSRQTIEALRQPLEDHVISVARARDNITFPANFILAATCNPCPCGYYGTSKPCNCLPGAITRYHQKLSGPIMDRIDLYIDVDEIRHESLLKQHQSESSNSVQKRIMRARKRQKDRYKAPITNARLNNKEIKTYFHIASDAETLLNRAAEQLGLSARAYMRVIKVAQTIADLYASDTILVPHITEALQYRKRTYTA